MSPQIAAVFCVFDDRTYLEYSIENISQIADKIFILANFKSWQSGEPLSSRYYSYLLNLQKKFKNLEVIKCFAINESEQRNFGLEILKKNNFDYCFVVDCDEFYILEDLDYIKRYIISHPEFSIFRIKLKTYWQSFQYRIEPPEPYPPVCCLKVNEAIFINSRIAKPINNNPEYIFNTDNICCYHMSYVLSDANLLKKLRRFTHSFEIKSNWFNEKWLKSKHDKNISELHPVHPEHYKGVSEENFQCFPEILKKHPYFNNLQISEEQKQYYGFNEKEINDFIIKIKENVKKHANRIFLIGPAFEGQGRIPWVESLKYHLEFIGFDVYFYSIFDMQTFFNLRNKRKVDSNFISDDLNLLHCHLQNEIIKFEPQIILDLYPLPEFIAENIKRFFNPVIISWFMESFTRNYPEWFKVKSYYALSLTIYDDYPEKLKLTGLNQHYLLMNTGCPVDVVQPDYSSPKDYDITIIGNFYPNRLNLLKSLPEYNIHVFGNYWQDVNLPNVAFYDGFFDFETINEICNKSKIIINLHSGFKDTIFPENKNAINPMTFLFGGTSALQFVDYRINLDEYFTENEEIIIFRDLDDLKNKLKYYLTYEQKCLEIVKRMNEKIFHKYTIFHSLNNIFALVLKKNIEKFYFY